MSMIIGSAVGDRVRGVIDCRGVGVRGWGVDVKPLRDAGHWWNLSLYQMNQSIYQIH